MRIGKVDLSDRVYVVAEVGGNHNGDPETAYRLVKEAAKAGVNAVKFQTYTAETLVHPSVEPVPLVKEHYRTQLERLKSLELGWEIYRRIMAMCAELGLDFLTTPFDLDILERFAPHMPAIKISSGDLTYHRLIRAAAATGKPVLLSTGMASLDEVVAAAGLVPAAQRVVLHCVSVYPLPDEQANLRAIPVLDKALPDAVVGYSDHTIGPAASLAAVALGARVIEKHFTLDRGQSPGDHVLSLDPAGMAALVHQIRRVEAMLGEAVKRPAPGEAEMRRMMRRGLYAARDLTGGAVLSAEDILCLRPATALDSAAAERLVGRRLTRDVRALEPIDDKALG